MAIALEIRVCYLLAKLAAYAFIILGSLKAAGAISALRLKSVLYRFYHFGVLVQSDFRFHKLYPICFVDFC